MLKLAVKNPYDLSFLGELPFSSPEQVEAALGRAEALYRNRDAWLSIEQRSSVLRNLGRLIEERRDVIAMQASCEGGKPLTDSLVEVQRAQVGVTTACEAIARLLGQEVPMGLGASSANRWAVTFREPRGVVFAISAFNHPFNLLIHQVITAIAAGCPVLIKPASETPLSCQTLLELLAEAGLPEGYCQMIVTDNELTQKVVSDERVAFLSFIGASEVGWMLRSRLAPGAACVLEHGGVAPVIVDETADLADALPLITKGAFYHAGQVCVSVQRLFVHESILSYVTEQLSALASNLVVGDPCDPATEVGPLIRPSEVDRVDGWVQEAVHDGAQLALGGKRRGPTLYEPTILMNPHAASRISRSEVFGPVLAVYSYRELDEAVSRANLKDSYFQAGFFTNRLDRALYVGRTLQGTAVMINDHSAFRVDWMPFGGHRKSGLHMGGIEPTMRDMTIERMLVFRQPPSARL